MNYILLHINKQCYSLGDTMSDSPFSPIARTGGSFQTPSVSDGSLELPETPFHTTTPSLSGVEQRRRIETVVAAFADYPSFNDITEEAFKTAEESLLEATRIEDDDDADFLVRLPSVDDESSGFDMSSIEHALDDSYTESPPPFQPQPDMTLPPPRRALGLIAGAAGGLEVRPRAMPPRTNPFIPDFTDTARFTGATFVQREMIESAFSDNSLDRTLPDETTVMDSETLQSFTHIQNFMGVWQLLMHTGELRMMFRMPDAKTIGLVCGLAGRPSDDIEWPARETLTFFNLVVLPQPFTRRYTHMFEFEFTSDPAIRIRQQVSKRLVRTQGQGYWRFEEDRVTVTLVGARCLVGARVLPRFFNLDFHIGTRVPKNDDEYRRHRDLFHQSMSGGSRDSSFTAMFRRSTSRTSTAEMRLAFRAANRELFERMQRVMERERHLMSNGVVFQPVLTKKPRSIR